MVSKLHVGGRLWHMIYVHANLVSKLHVGGRLWHMIYVHANLVSKLHVWGFAIAEWYWFHFTAYGFTIRFQGLK